MTFVTRVVKIGDDLSSEYELRMADNEDFLAELESAKETFVRVLAGLEAGTFEDLLKYVESLHTTVIEALDTRSPQRITIAWVALASEAYFRLRGAVIESYRRDYFTPYESGNPRGASARLYRALATRDRRFRALDSLLLLSRVTWVCELLRRNPDQLPLELSLIEASRHCPELVLPQASSLVRWETLPGRFRELQVDVVERFRAHSVEVVNLLGITEALRIEADAARLRLGTGSPLVTHAQVITLYERLIAFLADPISSSWDLCPLYEYSPGLSLPTIFRTLGSHEVRVETVEDGLMTSFLSMDPLRLKSLFIEAGGVRYYIVLPSADCLFETAPTRREVARFEENPADFLTDRIDKIPKSGTVQDLAVHVEALRHEQHTLDTTHAVTVASVGAASAITSRALAKAIGAPDVVVDLIEPFVLAILVKTFVRGKVE